MEGKAVTKGLGISPRKVRLVADVVRQMPVAKALPLLQVTNKRGASVLVKTLQSAVANAVSQGAQADGLVITRLEVNGGMALKRMHMAARGRVRPYKKRMSQIIVVVSDGVNKTEEKIEKGGKK